MFRNIFLPIVGVKRKSIQKQPKRRREWQRELIPEECIIEKIDLILILENEYDSTYDLSDLMINEALSFYCEFNHSLERLTRKTHYVSHCLRVLGFDSSRIIVEIARTNKLLAALIYLS